MEPKTTNQLIQEEEPVDQRVFLMGYGIEQNADKGHLRLDLTFISKDLLVEKYGAFIKDFNQFLRDRNKKLVKIPKE